MLSTANELIQKYEDTCSAYGDLPHASYHPYHRTPSYHEPFHCHIDSLPPRPSLPPPTRTTVQAPPTTTAPGENSGPTGTNGGNGLPSLGDGNGALSNVRDGKWTVVAVAAVALGMLVL
ncbi:hypothetical protein NMY22_g6968 [Coprinellus aureogranulatus]|nr:hypothetical protein NMY22_g6968 [Coprinellus aureogranulatus]